MQDARCMPLRRCFVTLVAACLLAAAPALPGQPAKSAGPAGPAGASVKAIPETGRWACLADVLSFFMAECPDTGAVVKVLETGGGDPAMNGAKVHVAVLHGGATRVWNTGLDIQRLVAASLPGKGRILLRAIRDVMLADGRIVSREETYRLRYHIAGETLGDALDIERAP